MGAEYINTERVQTVDTGKDGSGCASVQVSRDDVDVAVMQEN